MQHSFWVFDTEILEIITSLFTVFLHICRKSLQDNLPHHLFYHQYLPTTIFHHHWPLIWIIQRKFLLPRKSLFLGFFCNSFSNFLRRASISSPRHNLLLAVLDSLQGGLRQSKLLQPQTSAHSSHEACVFILYLLLKLPDVIFQLLLLIPGSLLSVLLLFTTYLMVEKPDSTKAMG